MATFDQRGQKVTYQYNAGGNINFGAVQSKDHVVAELQKLQAEVRKAAQAGALDDEIAIDVETEIKKAALQTQKPEPDKGQTISFLDRATALLRGITSAAGLVTGLTQAVEMIRRLY